jgi:hypothetical protein
MSIEVVDEKIRDMGNYDLKRDYRREWVYFLWLRGKKLKEIEEITEWDRVTVWRDIKHVRENLEVSPRSVEQIRQEALLMLQLDRAEILKKAYDASDKDAWRYFKIVSDIDMMILERYTQPARVSRREQEANEKMMAIIDYMLEKLGPDSMGDFEEWYTARMAAKHLET